MKGTILRLWDLQVLIIAKCFDIYSHRAYLFPSRRPLRRIQQWSAMVKGEMPECSEAAKHDAYWAGRMATAGHMVALLTQTGQLGPGRAWSLYRPIVWLRCSRRGLVPAGDCSISWWHHRSPHSSSSSSWALLSFHYMCGHIVGRDVVPHRTTVLHKYR